MKYFFLPVLIITLLIGCSEGKNSILFEYQSEEVSGQWNEYLLSIGHEELTKPVVLLILRVVDCKTHFTEIEWWEQEFEPDSKKISVVIAERFESYYETAVNELGLHSETYQDSGFKVIQEELAPSLPVKVYINPNRNKVIGSKMGSQHSIDTFLEKIDGY